jgi:crossover junction endodeoxyribonuclease RuvC
MIVLGIDPGTATTGWGVVEYQKSPARQASPGEAGGKVKSKKTDGNSKPKNSSQKKLKLVEFGCILTNPEEDMPKRLLVLRRELKRVLQKYSPDGLVVEKLFFGVNSRTAMAVGQARGVVMLAAAEAKVPLYEYTGLEVKLEVANHGRSDKKTVQTAVKRHLGVTNLRKPKDQQGKEVNRFRDDAYDAVAAALCHLSKQNLLS